MRTQAPWTVLIVSLAALVAGCQGDDPVLPAGGTAPAPCQTGDTSCSEDARQLLTCRDGVWEEGPSCVQDGDRLCQDGRCVDPWFYGTPVLDPCTDDPHATGLSLAAKAAKYDRLAEVLHLHPAHKRVAHVTLNPGFTEETATYEDVARWHTGENDGLWTGLYIASQAFRYAVTREAQALANLRVLMEGMEKGMRVTGVSGLFTREYITPGIAGMSCPSSPSSYVPSEDKKDNRWVKVDEDGTVVIYDPAGERWVRTDHRVPAEYAGTCWLDNVSQDEYAGHMLALASVIQLVDDPEVRGKAAQLAEEVSVHLMENALTFVDWDGRITEHGAIGVNPAFTLGFFVPGVVGSGREDLRDYYHACLLNRDEGGPEGVTEQICQPFSYINLLRPLAHLALYLGEGGCKSNWNGFAMSFCAMFSFLFCERDAELRTLAGDVLETELFYHQDHPREMSKQHNAAWTILYASMKNHGPGSTGQDVAALQDAVCALRQFPESKSTPSLEVGEETFPTDPDCESRFDDRYLTFDPVPVYLRCPSTFTWWRNPYEHQSCEEDPTHVKQPADYLLPYWMGRYFGYIQEGW